MQQRLVRKRDLEIILSRIEPLKSPKAYLEQYTITPEVAAELLYIAAYSYNDVAGKTIADLGCGTGRLAIGAAVLGAEGVIGIDIDKAATKAAFKNAEKLNFKEKIQWVTGDVATLRGTFDTVLQNPPFGVQKRQADRIFLEKALQIGKHVYSLHKSIKRKYGFVGSPERQVVRSASTSPSPFLEKLIESQGGQLKAVYTMPMMIPHMFDFHRKRKHRFFVDLYVIETCI